MNAPDSVREVTRPGQVQRDAGSLRGRGHFVVTNRPTGMHDRLDPGPDQRFQAVREREERIRGADCAPGSVTGTYTLSLHDALPDRKSVV